MYEYKAKITNVVDGDTFDFEIDLGFGITYKNRLRLYGLDTPEVRGSEREEGLRVKDYVKQLIDGKEVILITRKWKGKYGRYIAEVLFTGKEGHVRYASPDGETILYTNLTDHLIDHNMARRMNY